MQTHPKNHASTAAPRDRFQKIVMRAVLVWCLLIVAEILHGIIRSIVLVPVVGLFRSNQIGVFTGSAIILLIAWLTVRWIGATRRADLLTVGLLWTVLTVTFEVVFGRVVLGITWERIAADYNILAGGLMPLGLVVLLLSPMIAGKLRNRIHPHSSG